MELPSQHDADPVASTSYSLDLFRTRLSNVFSTKYSEEDFLPFEQLLPDVNEGLANELMFGRREAMNIVRRMAELNELMEDGGMIYKI